MNVGSGGGAAAAPTSGGAAAAAPAEEAKEEEKEEGMNIPRLIANCAYANLLNSQGGVRRGYGLRSLRLDCLRIVLRSFSHAWPHGHGHGAILAG